MMGVIGTVRMVSVMREYKRLLYSSADRRFRKREDVVVLDSSPCDYEDHPVTRRDESDITAVQLAALHHGTHCVGFLTSRRKSAGIQQLLGLIQIWYITGTYDQLILGGRSGGGAGETDTELCGCPSRSRQSVPRFSAGWRPSASVSVTARCSTNQRVQGDRARSTTLPWTRVEFWRSCRRRRQG